jgi:hypothetical protein
MSGGHARRPPDREETGLTRTAKPAPDSAARSGNDRLRAETRPSRPASRPRAGLRWGGLVLLLAAVQVALLWRRFYYGNDDLLQFTVAHRAGLSWELLSLNVFQHVAPYNRLGHFLVYLTGMSPFAGLALMTLNLVALLFGCLWLMTELGLSSARRVVGLVLIGLSVSVSESAIWLDPSMHILSALAVTMAVCAAHVRGVRTGSNRWHAAAVVLFVAGQLFQERPIFALPLAVLTDVLLLWRDAPWRERIRRLWAIRWPLASLVVSAALIAAWLQAYVVLSSGTTPTWGTTGRTMLLALTDYLVPSLVNVPLSRPSSVAVQLVILVGIVVVGVILARLRRGNAGPVLFAAAAFLLYYGFLKFSPILVNSPVSIELNARRLHNAVYVTVPLVIALVCLRGPGSPRNEGAVGRAHARPVRALAVLGTGVLAAYLAFSGNAYLERRWADTTQARAYLDAVRANEAEWSDPDVTLIPLSVPPAMSTSWSRAFGRQDRLLPFIAHDFVFQDLGRNPVIIDSAGAVRPAALIPVRGRASISSGACGPRDPIGPVAVRAESHVVSARTPAFLMVSYRAREDVRLGVVTDPGLSPGVGFSQLSLPAGVHTRVVPLDDLDVRDLVATGSGALCISRLSIVCVAQIEDGGDCRYLDRYGRPTSPVTCPS